MCPSPLFSPVSVPTTIPSCGLLQTVVPRNNIILYLVLFCRYCVLII